MKEWVPLFSQLVWPAFLIGLLVVFWKDAGGVIKRIEEAIVEGRSVQVGEWLKIGERTAIGELASAGAAEIGEDVDLSVDAVGGYQDFVEKSSFEVLERLKSKLHQTPTQRIDVMLITSGRIYSTKLLSSYIASLGIRFVVFQDAGRFDGWMGAGLFNSQLPTQDDQWPYDRLRSELIGVSDASVSPAASAIDVLKAMDAAKVENMAVVDNGRFKFIANRESIIAKLLTASIFKNKESK